MRINKKWANLILSNNIQLFFLYFVIFLTYFITGIFSLRNISPNNSFKNTSSIFMLARKQSNIIVFNFSKKWNNPEEDINYQIISSKNILSKVSEIFPLIITGYWNKRKGYFLENWIENNRNNDFIRVVNLDNGTMEEKIEIIEHINEESVSSIAYDWTTNNLFVGVNTDSIQNTGRIDVCKEIGQNKTQCGTIIYRGLNNLESLSLDPLDGYMYWINRNSKRVERSFINGKHHEKHPFQENYYTISKIYKISSLSLDVVNKKLYYISSKTSISLNEIISCEMYQRDSCKSIINNINAFQIGLIENNIFWSSLTKIYGEIESCNINNCNETKMTIANSTNIEYFCFIGKENQPQRVNPNPCAINNGNCSHFCILHPGEPFYSCHCPVGINLLSDKKTCNPNGIEKILFIASASGLLYISLDTDEFIPRSILANNIIKNNDNNENSIILDIDYDNVNQYIYWIEEKKNKNIVRRIKLNGNYSEEVLISNKNESINSLKIDYYNDNIIWLDSSNGKIEMMSLKTKARKVIYFSKYLKKINTFAYDYNTGTVLFYEKRHAAYIIKKLQVDGNKETSLIHLPLESYPTGIEIDLKKEKFYWAESGSNSILSASLNDGRNVEIIISGLHNPQSISKLDNKLYFNSINDRGVNYILLDEIVNDSNDSLYEYIDENIKKINIYQISDNIINGNQKGLIAVNVKETNLTKLYCKNYGCSHICSVIDNNNVKCLCPSGMILNNLNPKECIDIEVSLIYSRFSIDDDLLQSSLVEKDNTITQERMYLDGISDSIQFIKPTKDGKFILIAGTGRNPSQFHQQIGFIKRINLINQKSETLLMSTSTPMITGLSIDEITGNIFFSNGYLKRIEVINKSGTVRRTFLWKNIDPIFVTVENTQNMIYFINDSMTIVRSSIYSNYENIFIIHKTKEPITSFTINSISKKIFWSTTSIHTSIGLLFSSDFDGSKKKQLYSSLKFHPLYLTTYLSKIYFYNKLNGTLMLYDNEKVNVIEQIDDLISMNIYYKNNLNFFKGIESQNPCGKDNEKNKCNYLCIPKNFVEYECLCNDHFELDKKTGTCKIYGEFLMISEGNKLLRIPILKSSNIKEIFSNSIPYYFDIPNIGEIHSLIFDPLSKYQYFYWIDSANPTFIYRSSFDITIPTITLDEIKELSLCKTFYYLSLDVYGRQIFLSCSTGNSLNSSSIHSFRITPNDNFQYTGTIIPENQYSPRQLSVYSKLNVLFFINALTDTTTQIIRCRFDGRNCKALSYTSTDDLPWHSLSLSIDEFTQRLIYVSPSTIFSKDVHIDLDLRKQLNINDKIHISQAFGMTGIAISHNYMAIGINSRANVGLYLLSYNISSHVGEFNDLISIQYYSPNHNENFKLIERVVSQEENTISKSFACYNSQCSHLCRSQRDFSYGKLNFECFCPYNLRLDPDNLNNCISTIPCKSYQFSCSDSLQCIHISKKCDRIIDCMDTSDENTDICYYNEFQTIDKEKLLKYNVGLWPCLSGVKSISKFEICDGKIDCPDKSDEMYCKCENPQTQFDCEIKSSFDFSIKTSFINIGKGSNYNGCIERYKLCDGFSDCINSTDEAKNLCNIIEATGYVKGTFNQRDKTFNLIIFGIGITIFLLLLCIIFINCFKRKKKKNVDINRSTETHVLLNQRQNNSQNPVVEVALKTYTVPSIIESNNKNSYILNSQSTNQLQHHNIIDRTGNAYFNVHHYTIDSSYTTAYDGMPQINGQYIKFYAPPPSAASLSTTYGVVKQVNNRSDSLLISNDDKKNYNSNKKSTSTQSNLSESSFSPPPPYERLLKHNSNQYKKSDGSRSSNNYHTLQNRNRRLNYRLQRTLVQEDAESDESNSNFI
uniref:EGF-like domain-containing protein n=1 Tax=Strongyloides stercoralis TaxID=6248 RepID=A0A0K0E8M7_STRER